ncbi:MAG: enoyl-CoA hydratase/isomerase family protein [Bacteroidetes bacterium]|nr:enoyl-CoA hydratase/isomerase family protein [Bacteroidota bacterium]
MEYQVLRHIFEAGILHVTISRPNALNALNTRFFDEMEHLLNNEGSREEVRVMVITGEGKAFVAGADIAEMVHMNPSEGEAFGSRGQMVFAMLEQKPYPVIAAINGFALGGGLELAMACDFRIASDKAKFGQPEVNLGLTPGYAGTQRLPRLIGLADALLLLTTGEMIDATEALRLRLVQKVVPHEQLKDEVDRIARLIVTKGPKAVEKVKLLARKGLELGMVAGSKLEAQHFGSLFGEGSQGREGMTAFLEKRKPVWPK